MVLKRVRQFGHWGLFGPRGRRFRGQGDGSSKNVSSFSELVVFGGDVTGVFQTAVKAILKAWRQPTVHKQMKSCGQKYK